MAEPIRFDETLRRLFEANLRCVEALGRAGADYIQSLSRVWRDAGLPGFPVRSAPLPPPQARPAPTASAATLLLEAAAGELAQGVFMVENRLARAGSASVVTSAFAGESGAEVWPTMRVQPGEIRLEPGARTLVQISALIDERLDTGVRYRGHVSVPGLSDTPIPIVVRRRFSPAVPPARHAEILPTSTVPPVAAAATIETGPARKHTRRRSTRRARKS